MRNIRYNKKSGQAGTLDNIPFVDVDEPRMDVAKTVTEVGKTFKSIRLSYVKNCAADSAAQFF